MDGLIPRPTLRWGWRDEGNHARHKSCDRSLLRRALTFLQATQQNKGSAAFFFAQDTSSLSLLEEASFNLLTMTTTARGPDSGVAIFAFVIALTLCIWASRRDKQCTGTNICARGLDFGKGKVGATPAIAAWCLRVDAGSQTLSS